MHEQLRHGTFVFQRQKGVGKKRVGKKVRPIVISPIPNRIVQRAILMVSETVPLISDVLNIPTSFGGITGADAAIALALQHSTKQGAWYVRSDIPDFFTQIPKPAILEFLLTATGEAKFVDLFDQAMAVELENEAILKKQDLYDYFPTGLIGVAQGSALSPLIGNILLRDFDKELNGDGITCIRYIDDFLLIGSSKEKVVRAFNAATRLLAQHNLEAYDPQQRSDKAHLGPCDAGFDFLGCSIKGFHIVPGKKARTALLKKVAEAYDDGIKAVAKALAGEDRGRPTQRLAQSHGRVDRIVKGWGESFAFCNDRRPIMELDRQITELMKGFDGRVRDMMRNHDDAAVRRAAGITLLTDIERKVLPSPEEARSRARKKKVLPQRQRRTSRSKKSGS